MLQLLLAVPGRGGWMMVGDDVKRRKREKCLADFCLVVRGLLLLCVYVSGWCVYVMRWVLFCVFVCLCVCVCGGKAAFENFTGCLRRSTSLVLSFSPPSHLFTPKKAHLIHINAW